MTTEQLADHAKKLRKAARLSLRQAAKRTGISHAHLHHFESGKVRNASARVLNAMAACYGVPVTELMNGVGKPRLAAETLAAMAEVERAVRAAYRRGYADGLEEKKRAGC